MRDGSEQTINAVVDYGASQFWIARGATVPKLSLRIAVEDLATIKAADKIRVPHISDGEWVVRVQEYTAVEGIIGNSVHVALMEIQ